jgi:hypothetical protein
MTTANTSSIFGLPEFSKQGLDEVKPLPVNTRELVIFDAGVDHVQQLIDSLKPGIDWVVLNPNQDGIEQITHILANYPEITTLHLVSHGAPGCLFLGNTQLSLDTLKQYTNYLQSWSASEILLYGCKVAAGDAGVEFINKLHNVTQANIAASQTLTGSSQQGGNWNLEITLGNIKAELAFLPQTQAAYTSVFNNYDPVHFDVSSVFGEDSIISSGTDTNHHNGLDDGNRSLITQSYAGSNQQGLPDDGLFRGNSDRPDIQLQYKDRKDRHNLTQITASTGSFKFSTQRNFYSSVHIAAFSTQGSSDVELTFHYSGNTSYTTSSATVPDWFDEISENESRYYLANNMDRAHSDRTIDDVNDVALFGLRFNNRYPSKTVTEITVSKTSGSGYFSFFGATGVVAELPPSISDTSFNINEDAANDDSVGTVTGTDVNGDTLTYSIIAGNNDNIFEINSTTGEITIADNKKLDYETTKIYSLTVQTSDSHLNDTATVTVNVGDVNEAPTGINVDNNNVDENATDGTTIGTLSNH